jgi:hypothetical protein
LDAKVPARFGELSLRAKGSVRWETRSGSTESPDESWSAWSAPATGSAPIKSPGARFVQVRAFLAADAELYALNAHYLPQNQPARVHNPRVRPGKAGEAKPSAQHKTVIPLTWEVDNPDEDRLRYRIFYRRDLHATWLPALREQEVLEQNEYEWETRALPDGYYRVRVEASDEAANPEPFVERTEALSTPILVDNHAPELVNLKVQGKLLLATVRDSLGPIESLEVSVDSAPFRPIFPEDGLLDTGEETVRVELGSLAPGTHMVSLRASDAAHNVSAGALEFQVER